MTKKLQPSRKARRLVTAFEQSAGQDMWVQNEGNGAQVANAKAACEADRTALLKFLAQLERRAAKAARVK
jgi:hypothetical protein